MKRFVALMIALGFTAAYGLGCTKLTQKEEATEETPAATEEAAPAPEAPAPAPAEEAQPEATE